MNVSRLLHSKAISARLSTHNEKATNPFVSNLPRDAARRVAGLLMRAFP